ncbi:MAG TPA: PEGA domain-containing protein [Polyangia bacterium]
MRRHVCAFCVGILVACASWSVSAGEKEEAKQLFESGLKLMRADNYVGASDIFERSIALYPTQNSLFNLANCYRAMQRYGDALATINRLKRDFADKLKPEIKEAIERQVIEIQLLVASLTIETDPADTAVSIDGENVGTGPKLGPLLLQPGEHEVEAARPERRSQRRTLKLDPGTARTEKFVLEVEVGSLVVRANLEGATVFVDGQLVGTTPLAGPVSLAAGKHVLNLRAAEHEDIGRAIDVRAGEKQFLDIALIAKPARVVVPEPATPPRVPELSLAATEEAKPKSRAMRILTWSSAIGAVAAVAGTGTFLVILNGQNSDFKKYNDLYSQYGRAQDDAKRRSILDDMHRSTGIAIGFGIGAGVLVTTAMVTYLLDSRTKRGENKPSLALSPASVGVSF